MQSLEGSLRRTCRRHRVIASCEDLVQQPLTIPELISHSCANKSPLVEMTEAGPYPHKSTRPANVRGVQNRTDRQHGRPLV